jgi:hypothetical protein
MEGTTLCFFTLIDHQVVKSTTEAGDQRYHEYNYRKFKQ